VRPPAASLALEGLERQDQARQGDCLPLADGRIGGNLESRIIGEAVNRRHAGCSMNGSHPGYEGADARTVIHDPDPEP